MNYKKNEQIKVTRTYHTVINGQLVEVKRFGNPYYDNLDKVLKGRYLRALMAVDTSKSILED